MTHNHKKKHTAVKFTPIIPNWPASVRIMMEDQLKNYKYFKARPHLYPCKNFDEFIAKTIKYLESRKQEFCWSLNWDPVFLSQLIYRGFLTIASEVGKDLFVMLPKLHVERCCIDLDVKSSTCSLPIHIGKTQVKKSRKYFITVDLEFEKVFEGCLAQHGMNWLYPPMQGALYQLFHNRGDPALNGVTAHSIEIWDENSKLVAGELGTSVGCIYTSLTGYFTTSGTGMIQLMALAQLLIEQNFKMWDLGMHMEYKTKFGAANFPRNIFLQKCREYRNVANVQLECREKYNIRQLFKNTQKKNNKQEMESNVNSSVVDEEMKNNLNVNESDGKPISKKHRKRLVKAEKRRLAKLKAKEKKLKEAEMNNNNNAGKEILPENIAISLENEDNFGNKNVKIKSALEKFGGEDWQTYFQNFVKQNINDSNVNEVESETLKQLIPKMGPRNRFANWISQLPKK